MNVVRKVTAGAVLVSWLGSGLYFGVAGWHRARLDIQAVPAESGSSVGEATPVTYEGVQFADEAELRSFLEQAKALRFFPWILDISATLGLVLTAASFGALGGVSRVLHRARRSAGLDAFSSCTEPLFALLVGVMVLAVASLVPSALLLEPTEPEPTSLLFLCLLAGAFADTAYGWVESRVRELFPRAKGDA